MKKLIVLIIILSCGLIFAEYPDGNTILQKIDDNMYSKQVVSTMQMIVYGNRVNKTMKLKSWSEGEERSFSEYLFPPKDAGTKMLKLGDDLWIFEPEADRTIQISGHMLRQSMMGSDLSYEDMMEETELLKLYDANVIGEEEFNESDCWILELTAKINDVAYQTRKIWVDKEKYLALKEERFGKSGTLLKTTEIKEVFKVDGRWYPKRIIIKDALKEGKGTEIIFDEIKFDVKIPAIKFSKASLRK
ncbi:MAG: outer membrane lipoprotein-sorting protein [Candidatus Cloacimonetes bacterium]|nr:outer membrane lipoprotein-sorting protein [Candidatus Cloacimonadota bacterium]MCF7814845.1 outer membrane lipoprotein-sorting protein [Candidatus Cloacimonadota bacterium]MCF7867901.1 outer membrane lipoprotein-sorting protein [Candidatus Cloacimonadota bacterium]MCF7883720.1 outer membrane lipoprotein-sorting protein [Candidatus Cloacimonadota bacterium]